MKLRRITILLIALLLIFGSRMATGQPDSTLAGGRNLPRQVSPLKATMLAAAFPGLGQVYNRKAWKIPVVYAGFGALGYSIVFNSTNHAKYLDAYRDLTDMIPETDSYTTILSRFDPEEFDRALGSPSFNPQTEAWLKDQLLNGVDYYRRYRDLSYIGVAVWYLITILDANVDANLSDYDIGESLTIELMPVPSAYGPTIGVGVSVTF